MQGYKRRVYGLEAKSISHEVRWKVVDADIGINVTRQNKNTPVRPLCGRTGVFIRLWTYSQGLDIPQQKAE